MHVQLKAKLQQKIQEWMDENCEEEVWPQQLVVGEWTSALMACAAAAVIDGITEAQAYALREGFYEKPIGAG